MKPRSVSALAWGGLSAAIFVLAVALRSACADTTLTWTSVGDDGLLGTASAYEMRAAPDTATIKAQGGTPIPLPAPKPSGQPESATVNATGWIGLRALDEVPNAGPWRFIYLAAPDTTTPAPPKRVLIWRTEP
jgi:hypothetical protein